MSVLVKSVALKYQIFKDFSMGLTATLYHWHKPGPCPKSEQERKKLAELYDLDRFEYKPFPDDDYGEYPKLPLEGVESKYAHYPNDDPNNKRNLNEPVHAEDVLIRKDKCKTGPRWFQWLHCLKK